MVGRLVCLTQKIDAEGTTLRGSLYAHVEHDGAGRIEAVRISSPGRFADTTMERVLLRVAEALTDLVREVRT